MCSKRTAPAFVACTTRTSGANLSSANLSGTELQTATGLTRKQIHYEKGA